MASGHPKYHKPESHYVVMAQVHEPNYDREEKFLRAELAFVERKLKLAEQKRFRRWFSAPSLGFYSRDDWRHYARRLEAYGRQLIDYMQDAEAGVIPMRLLVYNSGGLADEHVHVTVHVKGGRLDATKRAPQRPERLDSPGHARKWQLTLPKPGFVRRGIKISPHAVTATFSGLDAHDGAALVKQVLHLHLSEDTDVTYEVMSRNVAHETGEVELVEREKSTSESA